jgi:hypothetical protein
MHVKPREHYHVGSILNLGKSFVWKKGAGRFEHLLFTQGETMPQISEREFDPFRKLIVYPSLLRSLRANWDRTMVALGT